MNAVKTMKKAMAVIVGVVALMLLCATAAFADTGKGLIVVENPQPDQSYVAYKIFDAAYSDDKSSYAYSIPADSEWFDALASKDRDGAVVSKVAGLAFQKEYGKDVYAVTAGPDFSAAKLAAVLQANLSGKRGIALTVGPDGKAAVDGLDLGYYFVSSATGALCNLTTADPVSSIRDKNEMPFEKTDDQESVQIGDTVHYSISGKVPDTTGFQSYIYRISDKMSSGLTFNGDIQVKIDGKPATEHYTVKTGSAAGDKDFVIDFDAMNLPAGATIDVTYSAVVNADAVAKVEKNHATLEYSNDPTDSSKTTTITDQERVYSAKVLIDKFAEGDGSRKLAGAQFVLKNNDGRFYRYVPASGSAGARVEWVDSLDQASVQVTDDNGAAEFVGLKDGTYSLVETKAPDGYNMLAGPVQVAIDGSSATDADLSVLTCTESISNKKGSILPATGGAGTGLFYLAGGVLVVAAGVLLIARQRARCGR